jgi:hypothetical protein
MVALWLCTGEPQRIGPYFAALNSGRVKWPYLDCGGPVFRPYLDYTVSVTWPYLDFGGPDMALPGLWRSWRGPTWTVAALGML